MWTLGQVYEWPVPVPKGANLDLIRVETLTLGVEYAWLDVLWLRQRAGPRKTVEMVCHLNGTVIHWSLRPQNTK